MAANDKPSGVTIRVRGSAVRRHAPERATVLLRATSEGPERAPAYEGVLRDAEELQAALDGLREREAVTRWNAGQLSVHADHSWNPSGEPGPLVHRASLAVSAEFVDFEVLSGFVGEWGARPGIAVDGIEWDVLDGRRGSYDTEVRVAAVEDALAQARAYAGALGLDALEVVELADPGLAGGTPEPRAFALAARAEAVPGPSFAPEDVVLTAQVDARVVAR